MPQRPVRGILWAILFVLAAILGIGGAMVWDEIVVDKPAPARTVAKPARTLATPPRGASDGYRVTLIPVAGRELLCVEYRGGVSCDWDGYRRKGR